MSGSCIRTDSRAARQLKAVLKKNLILMGRNKRDAMRELGMPIIMLLVLVSLSNISANVGSAAQMDNNDQSVVDLQWVARNKQVWVAPCGADGFAQLVATEIATTHNANVTCFPCEFPSECGNSILAAYPSTGDSLLAAVIFDGALPPNPLDAASPVRYRIRMDASNYVSGVGSTNYTAMYAADGSINPPDQTPAQYIRYFLPVQTALDAAITNVLAGPLLSPPLISWSAHMYPTPEYSINVMAGTLTAIVPIYMVLIFTLQVRVLLTRILEEKERKIKIALKMMGLSDAMFWASWAITAGAKIIILVTLVSGIACATNIFRYSNFGVIWLLFMAFGVSCVTFSFALTTLFSKSTTGGVVGMLLYMAVSTPSYALVRGGVPPGVTYFLSLLAPCAFSLGNNIITSLEVNKEGANWNNFSDPSISPAGVSLSGLVAMIALDAMLYLLLAWYLDRVVPSEFGTTQHPLFCLGFRWRTAGEQALLPPRRSGRWFSSGYTSIPAAAVVNEGLLDAQSPSAAVHSETATVASISAGGTPQSSSLAAAAALLKSTADVEGVSQDVAARPGVHINGLRKVFPGSTTVNPVTGMAVERAAVDGLNLSMYEGEVTALLGHNGAGKTSTVSMLTGLIAPTSGDALVYGKSIVNEMPAIRDMIGICPQHDVLFDQLTVEEHLYLYGGIKGVDADVLKGRVTELISDVGLIEKQTAFAVTLSGGQKRRLSVAIAMIGLPRLLILDEPTSGLDPAARRKVWQMIQKHKAGRVIILTTHFMDEADILGDRIALMARGRLRVFGTSMYLKNKFGLGYHLSVTGSTTPGASGSNNGNNGPMKVVPSALSKAVVSYVPGAKATHHHAVRVAADTTAGAMGTATIEGVECAFVLPTEALPSFPALLDALDTGKNGSGALDNGCHVLGYSLSITTLEEVFLRLQQLVQEEEEYERQHQPVAAEDIPASNSVSVIVNDAADHADTPLRKLVKKWWWLDVRRRDYYARLAGIHSKGLLPHSAAADTITTDAPVAADHAGGSKAADEGLANVNTESLFSTLDGLLASPKPMPFRGTFGFTWGQVLVQLWRKYVVIRRNRRAFILQCIMPIFFVCIGLIFRVLRSVDSPTSNALVPASPAGFAGALQGKAAAFGLPVVFMSAGFAPWLSTYQASVADNFPSSPATLSSPILSTFPGGVMSTDMPAWDTWINNASYTAASLAFTSLSGTGEVYGLDIAYNYTLTNVLPAIVNLWDSAVLLTALNASNKPAPPGGIPQSIQTAFDPLPDLSATSSSGLGVFISSALLGFYMAVGFIIIPALQAASVVKERESQTKQLQLMMGSTVTGYWLATWLWDVIQYSVPFVGGFIVICASNASAFTSGQVAAVTLLLLMYGVSIPGPTYCLSFLFNKHTDAQLWIRLGYTGLLILTFFGSFALGFPGLSDVNPALGTAASVIKYIALVFPPYALSKGYIDVVMVGSCSPATLAAGLSCIAPSPFSWEVAGAPLLYMVLLVPLTGALVMYLEKRAVPSKSSFKGVANAASGYGSVAGEVTAVTSTARSPANEFDSVTEDDDVLAERHSLDARFTLPLAGDLASGLTAMHLRKVYERRNAVPKVAVADLSLRVHTGEVFGLLGPNGAGKTTTLSMLVAEQAATSGGVWVNGTDVAEARHSATDLLGYCPQMDALFEFMTGAEVLTFFAAINGVPPEHLPTLVAGALAALDLTRDANKQTRAYSGGNKRRLALAAAYIAAPPSVYLDECSTGVDPFARRRMFDVIQRARTGRTTVMTTHVMEEADGLCHRIGIMVDGRMACVGSGQHLKEKYGRGYIVQLQLAETQAAAGTLVQVCAALGSDARILEQNSMHARLEVVTGKLAGIFRALERFRLDGSIVDYSVAQATLEAVFLSFSKKQEVADERHRLLEAQNAAARQAARGQC